VGGGRWRELGSQRLWLVSEMNPHAWDAGSARSPAGGFSRTPSHSHTSSTPYSSARTPSAQHFQRLHAGSGGPSHSSSMSSPQISIAATLRYGPISCAVVGRRSDAHNPDTKCHAQLIKRIEQSTLNSLEKFEFSLSCAGVVFSQVAGVWWWWAGTCKLVHGCVGLLFLWHGVPYAWCSVVRWSIDTARSSPSASLCCIHSFEWV
jgi:hypothetical protein